MRTILVPVDGSTGAAHAAKLAGQLAGAQGAEVVLLHVYDLHSAATMGLVALSSDQLESVKSEVARSSFEGAKKQLGLAPRECKVALGDPAQHIVEVARSIRADMIVMGSRGRSQVQELLLGSVSNKVVHHAPCPVTIVR